MEAPRGLIMHTVTFSDHFPVVLSVLVLLNDLHISMRVKEETNIIRYVFRWDENKTAEFSNIMQLAPEVGEIGVSELVHDLCHNLYHYIHNIHKASRPWVT